MHRQKTGETRRGDPSPLPLPASPEVKGARWLMAVGPDSQSLREIKTDWASAGAPAAPPPLVHVHRPPQLQDGGSNLDRQVLIAGHGAAVGWNETRERFPSSRQVSPTDRPCFKMISRCVFQSSAETLMVARHLEKNAVRLMAPFHCQEASFIFPLTNGGKEQNTNTGT